MTSDDSLTVQAFLRENAQYLAIRAVALAVMAFIGLLIASLAVSAIAVYVVADSPFDYPSWADILIGFFVVAGTLWFVTFLILSLGAFRRHSWFHRNLIEQIRQSPV